MKKPCVLFVDDEANILAGLRRLLRTQRSKWEMLFAHGGHQALDIMSSQDVDVLVSDMRMPELDGAALFKAVMKKHPKIVRLILSGQSHKTKLLEVVGTAHQFLSKPCDSTQLVATIEQAIHRQQNPGLTENNCVSQITSLHSQKGVFEKLKQLLEDPDTNSAQIAQTIENDLGLTIKVMQLVNSSFFGNTKPTSCVSTACEMLGKSLIKELFDETAAFSFLIFENQEATLTQRVNEYCRQVAVRATSFARMHSQDEKMHQTTYLAALLHDAGKLVMVQNNLEQACEMFGSSQDQSTVVELNKERDAFGASHCEIGANLVSLWGFGDEVIETCHYHHQPELSGSTDIGPLAFTHIAIESLRLPKEEACAQLAQSSFIQRINATDLVRDWLSQSDHQLAQTL